MLRISAQALIQFSELWRGSGGGGCAHIIASITHEIHKCNMEEFCYNMFLYKHNVYKHTEAQISKKISIFKHISEPQFCIVRV